MLFTLEPIPAKDGNCFLLHYGTLAHPRLALIDGGPGTVWEDSLWPRLEQMLDHRNRDLLEIEFVMISRADDVHLHGAASLFSRLRSELAAGLPETERTLAVNRLWLNSLDAILGQSLHPQNDDLLPGTRAAGRDASLEWKLPEAICRHEAGAEQARVMGRKVALLLDGHAAARELLATYARLRHLSPGALLNDPFPDCGPSSLITAEATPLRVAGISVTILGPRLSEIRQFQAALQTAVASAGSGIEDALLKPDLAQQAADLAAMVCLIEKRRLRMLFTGEASGEYILRGLRNAALLNSGGRMLLDILQVPRHLSDPQDFFHALVADNYILPGDGTRGFPARAMLESLIDSREPADDYTIQFTYSLVEIDTRRRQDAKERQQPWDDQRDSLAALIQSRREQGCQFVLAEGAPHNIDLGNESPPW